MNHFAQILIFIFLLVAIYLGYVAGYWDGYHAGAIIYVGGQP